MNDRTEIQNVLAPMIRQCLREFGDYSTKDATWESFDAATKGALQPDIRRVSLIVTLAQAAMGADAQGEGLEVGCGYAYLLFAMSVFMPNIHWSAVEHPDRLYFSRDDFRAALRKYNCDLKGADLTRERLPFEDGRFGLVTFSETLEHLPVERLYFVLGELARVTRPGGILIASSPNQASWENRLRLLKGKSIFDMPDEMATARGVFGHIRLYTQKEFAGAMSRHGFTIERTEMETNISGYRGASDESLRRRLYQWYERLEARVRILRPLADTWYMVLRKR